MGIAVTALLQQAIDALVIQDVYFRASEARLEDDFDPRHDPDMGSLSIEYKHLVTHSRILTLEDEEKSEQLFQVFIDLGTRWVLPAGDEADEPQVRAHIEATLVAEYRMKSDPGSEALQAFALQNASFHAWPYWREFLSSQCLRMNLPKLVLPARQFAFNHDEE